MSDESKIDDGGPAFPRPTVGSDAAGTVDFGAPGMSLRDWFAGMALQGMNASPALLQAVTSAEAGAGTHYDRLMRHAYMQADAMLAERKRGET